MRTVLALACAVVLGALVWSAVPLVWGDSPRAVAIYEPNPSHLWNRLHATFFVRDDLPDTQGLPDALDPPLWYHTRYLLSNPSHKYALRILDEFLQTHAENLIRDPIKRAILQRDLWAVFDWAVERRPERVGDRAYEKEKRELQTRIAEVLRRIALTPAELAALPNNYAQAVASGEFGREYDPAHRERPFLPADLFEPHGPWVELEDPGNPEPIAFQHVSLPKTPFGGLQRNGTLLHYDLLSFGLSSVFLECRCSMAFTLDSVFARDKEKEYSLRAGRVRPESVLRRSQFTVSCALAAPWQRARL